MHPHADPPVHPRALSFLHARAKAQARGDANMVRTMNVELARMGYADPRSADPAPVAVTAVLDAPRPKRAGRPKMPRCEHDVIASRCPVCLGEVEDDPSDDGPLDSPGDATGEFDPSDGLGVHSTEAALSEPENGSEDEAPTGAEED